MIDPRTYYAPSQPRSAHLLLTAMPEDASTWKLRRTAQCAKCPWRVETNPREIPNGYSEQKHRALASTIAEPGSLETVSGPQQAMACHETEDAHCVGWIAHQLGPGQNLGLRLHMTSCENAGKLRLRGEQHDCLEDTLPSPA